MNSAARVSSLFFLGVALLMPTIAVSQYTVQIEDGDTGALNDALCAARASGEAVTIELAHRGHYLVDRWRWNGCRWAGLAPLPVEPGARQVSSSVLIQGNHATLDLRGERGFVVTEEGRLEISFLELRNSGESSALENRGYAELQGVSFFDSEPSIDELIPLHARGFATINNKGTMALSNVVIAGSRLTGVPADFFDAPTLHADCETLITAGVLNSGELILNNATLFDNEVVRLGRRFLSEPFECLSADIMPVPRSSTRVANSVLASRHSCQGEVDSLGYNSVRRGDEPDEPDCGFTAENDRLEFARLVDIEPVFQLGRNFFSLHSGSVHEGSSAEPGTSEGACDRIDGRGYFRREGACLRGAFDNRAIPNFHPGLGGVWFDPSNDGQYLVISHYGVNEVLLVWNTFDASGQREWIYGIGDPDSGREVETDAFVNDGIALVDGMIVGDLDATASGQFVVSVNSCQDMDFEYRPLDSSIASQRHSLKRLTANEAANCSEGPAID